MSHRKLRLYEPAWITLKTHRTLTLRAPKHLHKRIAKGLIQEKWKDKSFNQREGWRTMWLTYASQGDELVFQLSYKLTELLAKDL